MQTLRLYWNRLLWYLYAKRGITYANDVCLTCGELTGLCCSNCGKPTCANCKCCGGDT